MEKKQLSTMYGLFGEREMVQMQHDILQVIMDYADSFTHTMTRWDAVNYCIGYYGGITKEHIEVINYLVRQGKLED